MNKKSIITTMLAFITFNFASCCSDEPQWADPEAHEKTEQLQKQYGPLMVGTWHYEKGRHASLSPSMANNAILTGKPWI